MKSIQIIKLIAPALILVSGTALAGVVNSKHDLSANVNTTTTQVCVFCHTPHNATAGVQPLWNRAETTQTFTMYASDTIDGTYDQPTGVSKLCLGCHDGSLALDNLTNAPGDLVPNGTKMGDISGTNANLGNDLSNDHPVSITYVDAGLNAAVDGFVGTLPLYNAGQTVECASCHNVHDNDTNQPFLRLTTDASLLCTTCHNK